MNLGPLTVRIFVACYSNRVQRKIEGLVNSDGEDDDGGGGVQAGQMVTILSCSKWMSRNRGINFQ